MCQFVEVDDGRSKEKDCQKHEVVDRHGNFALRLVAPVRAAAKRNCLTGFVVTAVGTQVAKRSKSANESYRT